MSNINFRPWTESEDLILRELLNTHSDAKIGEELKRSRNSVFTRRGVLGLSRRRVRQASFSSKWHPRQAMDPFRWCGTTMEEQRILEHGRLVQEALSKDWGAREVQYLSRWVL